MDDLDGSESLSDVADRDGSHAVPPGLSLDPLRMHLRVRPWASLPSAAFAPRPRAAQPSGAIEWDCARDFNSPLVSYFPTRVRSPKWTGRGNGANIRTGVRPGGRGNSMTMQV